MPDIGRHAERGDKIWMLAGFLLGLAMMVSKPGAAQTNGCGPVQKPTVTLEFIHMDPMQDRYRSVRWLNSRAGGSPRAS